MVTGQAEQLRQQVVRGIGWRRKKLISTRRSGQKTTVHNCGRDLHQPLALEQCRLFFFGDTSDTVLMGNGGR